MTRTQKQSRRPIQKSIHEAFPVGQAQTIVEGQVGIGQHMGFTHAAIVARAAPMAQGGIKQWPKVLQPREKLRLEGARALSDAELLAIFLRVGVRGKSAVALAQDLLLAFGSLAALLTCSLEEISKYHGMGLSKWAQIQAAYELVKRSLEDAVHNSASLTSPQQLKEFLQTQIGRLPHEVFLCLYLDSQNCLIECQELFRGSITQTAVYPREILKEALNRNASALIVAHNHPSGNPLPSAADIALTETLHTALQLVDIPLLDHCIVSHTGFFSFLDSGLINKT